MSSERVLKLSAAYRAYAERLLDEALAQESRGEISPGEVDRIQNGVCKTILREAVRIVLVEDAAVAAALAPHLKGLETHTGTLDDAMSELKQVTDIFAVGEKVAIATASVALVVTAPTAAAALAAGQAVAAAVQSLRD